MPLRAKDSGSAGFGCGPGVTVLQAFMLRGLEEAAGPLARGCRLLMLPDIFTAFLLSPPPPAAHGGWKLQDFSWPLFVWAGGEGEGRCRRATPFRLRVMKQDPPQDLRGPVQNENARFLVHELLGTPKR